MSSRGQGSEKKGLLHYIRPVALSIAIGIAVCALALLLLSFLMTLRSVPQGAIDLMAGFALIIGGFAAGFCCAKMVRSSGLVYGAICGGVMTMLLLLASLLLKDNSFGLPALLKTAFLLFSAMIGGVLGVNSRQRRRR